MNNARHRLGRISGAAALAMVAMLMAGCPPVDPAQLEYDLGYDAGFLLDEWYWQGYDDSLDTLGYAPLFYQGSDIPYLDELSYDAGYYDGTWYAYNDGYFTAYRYAFVLGFSEGYDNAFWDDYLEFLAADIHVEYDNGGWDDGYEDGFSEGRIFGAVEFEEGYAFDWLAALRDYEDEIDYYFEELDLGSGAYGPVWLYEYGTDPNDFKSAAKLRPARKKDAKSAAIYRPLTEEAAARLDATPTSQRLRGNHALRVDKSASQRITDYLAVSAKTQSRD